MKNIWATLQVVIAAIGGWFGYFLGGFDGFLYCLVAFVILDYVTGVMVGIIEKKLSSEIGFRGIFKKILMFVLVGVGNFIDLHLIGSGSVFRTAVLFFYISNEGISILENAAKIGLPIPQKLKDILSQLKREDDSDDNK